MNTSNTHPESTLRQIQLRVLPACFRLPVHVTAAVSVPTLSAVHKFVLRWRPALFLTSKCRRFWKTNREKTTTVTTVVLCKNFSHRHYTFRHSPLMWNIFSCFKLSFTPVPFSNKDSQLLMVKIVMIMHVEIHTTFLTSTGTLCTRRIRGHKEPSNVTNPFLRWLALVILLYTGCVLMFKQQSTQLEWCLLFLMLVFRTGTMASSYACGSNKGSC